MEFKTITKTLVTTRVTHKGFTFTVDPLNRVKAVKPYAPEGFTIEERNLFYKRQEDARLEVKEAISK